MNLGSKIIKSRNKLIKGFPPPRAKKAEEEGGCGVTGFTCSIPVSGRHIFEPSIQMHNRGNGKGGGIAAVGFLPESLGVSEEVLENDYLLQIALLAPEVRKAVEDEFITPYLKVDKKERIPTLDDFRDIEGLEIRPPDVWRYFVRVKEEALSRFIKENSLSGLDRREAEDEFIYQNTYRLNTKFYVSLGEKKAFVLSHGRNMMILKIVGYAEQVVQYYQMEDFKAHIWIAHQRYPTRGRVWHPGGAHPFIGLNEALVHNGDFANYHSVSEYLKQRNIHPLFLTDTEVSVLLFDLLNRVHNYPLEYIIEALAPTTELDFDQLPPEKQEIYRTIATNHIHGSPDGPWFFIIARNEPKKHWMQLIGITDTAMLRPQVFAIYEGEVQIGLVCSEKQAIDATLHSLSLEDKRFCPIADRYWNARGGSHTDGGAFIFTIKDDEGGHKRLVCTDKFGKTIKIPEGQVPDNMVRETVTISLTTIIEDKLHNPVALFKYLRYNIWNWDYDTFKWCCRKIEELAAKNDTHKEAAIEVLTLLNDRRFDPGSKKRSWILHIIRESLHKIFSSTPVISKDSTSYFQFIDWERRDELQAPGPDGRVLIINANGFPPEGDNCDARCIVKAYNSGWKRFIVYGSRGQRFCGCGLGPDTTGVRIDAYDSSGDYLASGIDGLKIYVHGHAQDQLGQIMKQGKLVVYGDVGQTFMYGAKGGEVYVMGNAAGRPLINACGKPRAVINGTCLDFLAESFMAGNPLNGGGFAILNGIEFDEKGRVIEQLTPYPGGNLFSLASGGAIYVRDPHKRMVEEQLNGGEFASLTPDDWNLILPYLKENERLFGISIENDLLAVDGEKRPPEEVYRKVQAVKLAVLTEVSGED